MIDEEAIARVASILRSGRLVQGDEVLAFERELARRTGRKHAVCVSSGTSALDLAFRALDLRPGDELLVPSLTWPSPAHVARQLGLAVRLTDVDPLEWNARAEDYDRARTPRTRAAVVIDQFGFPVRQDELDAALEDTIVVEDAACALGSLGERCPAGGFGHVSCLSFHPRKIVTTGEGGACLTDDDELAERLRALRNHGQRAPGEFLMAAGNHRLTDFAAALGRAQLGHLDDEIASRRAIAERMRGALPFLELQAEAPRTRASFQTLGALLPEGADRDATLSRLLEAGVGAGRLSYALGRLGTVGEGARAPIAESIAERGIALPVFGGLDEESIDHIIRALERAR